MKHIVIAILLAACGPTSSTPAKKADAPAAKQAPADAGAKQDKPADAGSAHKPDASKPAPKK